MAEGWCCEGKKKGAGGGMEDGGREGRNVSRLCPGERGGGRGETHGGDRGGDF